MWSKFPFDSVLTHSLTSDRFSKVVEKSAGIFFDTIPVEGHSNPYAIFVSNYRSLGMHLAYPVGRMDTDEF
jgi:hypothetical protein